MINILIVGTGKIASRFMLGINNIEGLNVAFIFSRDILNAKKFSEVWSIKNYTDNFNNISDEIDIAYISTPTNTHYDIASILIRKKINVLVEKPIVTNSTHLRRLISLAKLYKVNIIDGMWTLYNPIVRNASFLTGNSTPLFIESYLCFDNQHNSNVLTDSKNGGAVKDILTYQLYLVALFCNSKKLEIINRQKFFNNNNVDYKYKLKIQSGRILAKLYGNIATRNGSRFVVHYKDFDLVIFYPIYNPKLLLFLPRNYYNIRVIFKCFLYNLLISSSILEVFMNRLFIKTFFYKNPLHSQLRHLIESISGNIGDQKISLKMTSMVVAVLDKLNK